MSWNCKCQWLFTSDLVCWKRCEGLPLHLGTHSWRRSRNRPYFTLSCCPNHRGITTDRFDEGPKSPLSLWREYILRMWVTGKIIQGLQDKAWGKESIKWCTWVLRLCLVPLKWGQCCQLNCIEPTSLGPSSG